ncbi:MAG: UDP-2,3-diacylglucosamine diphosphatase [Bacteroidales bacterium]|nr:UDP-2,3-diacylglucosamine diphosphatase [Bacteroidales bacterium]
MERTRIYFASDVHLGLDIKDPKAREARFVDFLRAIPASETAALYLLGDIWDFWYEYRDVVPKGYVRVFAALQSLMDAGVEVFFCAGNHDIWCYSYFEELGMKKIEQPYAFTFAGKNFVVGHGDGLGPGLHGYKLMNGIFKNRICQVLFSMLHPWFAFRFGNNWSSHNRLARGDKYHFKGPGEPLYEFACEYAKSHKVDYFVFGHIHSQIDLTLPGGERLMIMDSWIDGCSYLYFAGTTTCFGSSQNME